MSALAADTAAGFMAGVWLAPGACDKHSTVAARHPEWILRKPDAAPRHVLGGRSGSGGSGSGRSGRVGRYRWSGGARERCVSPKRG